MLTKAEIKLIESVHPITRNNDLSLNTRDSDQILPKNRTGINTKGIILLLSYFTTHDHCCIYIYIYIYIYKLSV